MAINDPADRVIVTEVLLRDGLQIEPVIVSTDDKVALGTELLAAGFSSLEVGAFVRADKVPQMADTPSVLSRLARVAGGRALHTLVLNPRGADRAIAAGAGHVRVVVSASDGHSIANAGAPSDEAVDQAEVAITALLGAGVHVEATIATAFVCPFDGETDPGRVAAIYDRLFHAGASAVHLADTIGAASPWHVRRAIRSLGVDLDPARLGLHLHDTHGLGLANAWEALQLGVRRFDASLGGTGGCPFAPGASGNIATEDLVNLLHHAGMPTGLDVEALQSTGRRLSRLLDKEPGSAMHRAGTWPTAPRVLPSAAEERPDPLELLNAFYAAELEFLARGSLDNAEEIFSETVHPDLVIHEALGLPYGGQYHGVDGLIRLMRTLSDTYDSVQSLRRDVRVVDDQVFVHMTSRVRSRRTGRTMENTVLQRVAVRDGRIVEMRPFHWDTAAVASLVSDTPLV